MNGFCCYCFCMNVQIEIAIEQHNKMNNEKQKYLMWQMDVNDKLLNLTKKQQFKIQPMIKKLKFSCILSINFNRIMDVCFVT